MVWRVFVLWRGRPPPPGGARGGGGGERRPERRRAHIRRHGEDRSLERGRGDHEAPFPLGKRDETVLVQVRPGPLGPAGVLRAHGLGGGGMVVVEASGDGAPVV